MAKTERSLPRIVRWSAAIRVGILGVVLVSLPTAGRAAAIKKTDANSAAKKLVAATKSTATKKTVARRSTTSQLTGVSTVSVKRRSVVLESSVPPVITIAPATPAISLPPLSAAAAAPLPTTTPPALTTTTPITISTLPATTAAKATTTSIPVTTAFDFDLQIPSPRVAVNMGSSAAMLVLVLPRGVARPVDLFFADLPNGITVTGTPNPTTGGSEVRLIAALLMVPGEYQLRVMAVAAATTKFVNYTLTVLTPGATAPSGSSSAGSTVSTTTSTTTIPSGSGGFTFVVTSDGKKLKTGGVVTLTATISPLSNFAGSAMLRVLDVPENVWVGYQQNPTTGTSSIWISSTLALKAGTYPLLVEAKTSTQTSQIPILLTIE